MKSAIFGCGYTGRVLVPLLLKAGHQVIATTRSKERAAELLALGAQPALIDPPNPSSYEAALGQADCVVYLAPPADRAPLDEAQLLKKTCSKAQVFLYGSTTGVFGQQPAGTWVDEDTVLGAAGARGQKRLDFERALQSVGLPLRVVRIAGIYGPKRTLLRSLDRGLTLFEDGPLTSRVHVQDLARLLLGMLSKDAPKLAVACDERPAPTLEVARYTCELLRREAPRPISLKEAKNVLSEAALEMRLSGRRCRSKVREKLIGPLLFPSYVEGIKASLKEEGAL